MNRIYGDLYLGEASKPSISLYAVENLAYTCESGPDTKGLQKEEITYQPKLTPLRNFAICSLTPNLGNAEPQLGTHTSFWWRRSNCKDLILNYFLDPIFHSINN